MQPSCEPSLSRRDLIARGAAFALASSLRPHDTAGTADTAIGDRTAPDQDALLRSIPSTGEQVPAIGLGTWQTFDVGSTDAERVPLRNVVRRFVDAGGSLIDSSPMYGRSETVVGELLHHLDLHSRVFLATKVWTRGLQDGIAQMRTSLDRLRTPTIDLMQVHNLVDLETHLRTLAAWKTEGRVRYVGITHYTAGAHDDLVRVMQNHDVDFVQVNYSLAERAAENTVLPVARDRGIAVLINRPFAEGALFSRARGRAVPEWAAEYGIRSWAQLFLKWILGHPAVTCVIPATSNPRHLEDNMAALRGRVPDAQARDRLATAFDQPSAS